MTEGPEEFLDEALTMMNLNKIEVNSRSSVVGTQVVKKFLPHDINFPNNSLFQEVYKDPRNRRFQMNQLDLNVTNTDGSSLSFKEKLKLFAK